MVPPRAAQFPSLVRVSLAAPSKLFFGFIKVAQIRPSVAGWMHGLSVGLLAEPFPDTPDTPTPSRQSLALGQKVSSGFELFPPPNPAGDSSDQPTHQSAWTATAWLSSLGIIEILARALLNGAVPADELQAVRALIADGISEAELVDRLRGVPALLAAAMMPALHRLARAEAATGEEMHGKFVQDGQAFTLKYGDLSTFFGICPSPRGLWAPLRRTISPLPSGRGSWHRLPTLPPGTP